MSNKYRCEHDKFSIRRLKKYGFHLYYDELTNRDLFPYMQNGLCTEECKEKMKQIYKITFDEYLKSVYNYFDDAKIFDYSCSNKIKRSNSCLSSYYHFLNKEKVMVPLTKPDYDVIKNTNVGIVNDKPIRLCDIPQGSTGVIDSSNVDQVPHEEFDQDEF